MSKLLDIIADQPPMDPTAPDGQSGLQVDRFGAVGAGGWKFAKFVTGAELAPTSRLQCIVQSQHRNVEWLVLPPPGVTDYDVLVGRWIQGAIGPLVVDKFIPDGDHNANLTNPLLITQKIERDPFVLIIDSVTGAPTNPVPGITRPNNPAAIPNAFVVLYRPASSPNPA
jgi:hypothetical protein